MKHERALGILILSDFVLTILGIVSEFTMGFFLPASLRAYLAADEAAASRLSDALLTALWIVVAVATVLGWIGMLNLARAGRSLYLGSWVGNFVLILLKGPLGLQTLFGVRAARKFPVLIIHGARDSIFPVVIARENRDKYKREGHEVKYVELKTVGHMWGTKAGINETIWKFFADHPLRRKYEPSSGDQR